MRAILVAARAPSVALALFLPLSLVAAEFKLPDADATPAELVNAALRSELDGPSEARKTLLDRALELDPDYAPARWHSGYVRWDDKWLTLDEVAGRAADDKQLAEYRKRRDVLVDRADDHRELARWCKKNGLVDEARVHWAKVLEFDPADVDALSALGLQLYEGQLLTKQQIVEAKRLAGERLQAMKRWQPQMVKWRKAIENLKGHDYDYALHEMRKLDDAEALPALEALFAENVAGPKADALNLALIETAGRIASPEATQVLLRRAIQPDSETVRAAACDQLKKRPMYAYVPQLIAAIPPKIESKCEITLLPNGMVVREHDVIVQGRNGELSINYESSILPADATAVFAVAGAAARESRDAGYLENVIRGEQARTRQLRERIETTLIRAAGFPEETDEEGWERNYNVHLETSQPSLSAERKYLSRSFARFESYFALPQVMVEEPDYPKPTAEQIAAQEKAEADWLKWFVQVRGTPNDPRLQRSHVCFPAGTVVLTKSGLVAIESIRAGDSVIAQNVATGEIKSSSVQRTTLRPAAPLVKLTLGSQTISATRGHPFWVNGQGWTIAKHLKVGQSLHGIDGATRIDAIEEAPPREVYNLVVGDDGTYFVGEQPVLVHDNTPLTETTAVVPGLTSEVIQ